MSKQHTALLGLAIISGILQWIFGLFKKPIPERIIRALQKAVAEEIKNDPECQHFTNVRSALTGEIFKAEWINAGMVPLISDQGYLLATHGNWEGKLSIGPDENGKFVFVDPWNEKISQVWIPGTVVHVLACYPAYRPMAWNENGVTFINVSSDPVPVYIPCVDGTLYYYPMPYKVALALKMI